MLKDPAKRYVPRTVPAPVAVRRPVCPEPGEERWHGTLGGYTNHACPCDLCRAAHRAYNAKARADRIANTPYAQIPHGTANGYNSYRCRCDPCKAAMAAARLTWPSTQKERRRAYRARQRSEGDARDA